MLAFIVVLAISVFRPTQDRIKIAIAAPLSNIGQSTLIGGESMVKGAQLYIDQINQAGGIDGRKIELQVYDDQNDAQIAAEVAHEIVDSSALAVIGHYSSSTSLVAGKIYQAYGIPAITGSATADDVTKWNNWYFRSTFVNSRQGLFIANYIKKILKRSHPRQSLYAERYPLGQRGEPHASSFNGRNTHNGLASQRAASQGNAPLHELK